MYRILALMGAIAALLFQYSSALAQTTTPAPELSCAAQSGNVNVRQQPDAQASIIGSITAGSAVDAFGYDDTGEWVQGVIDNRAGWASASAVTCSAGEPTSTPTVTPTVTPIDMSPSLTPTPLTALQTTELPATPTAAPETAGSVCVEIFDDKNVNGVVDGDDGEPQSASFAVDDASAQRCAVVAEGRHLVVVTVPSGFQASLSDRWDVNVRRSKRTKVLVGIAPLEVFSQSAIAPESPGASGLAPRTPLANVGVWVVAAGAVVLLLALFGIARERRWFGRS